MASCKTTKKEGEVIRGKFRECLVKHQRFFAKGSYRWVKVNAKGERKKGKTRTSRNWLLMGCPLKQWNKKKQVCKVKRQVHKKLSKIGKSA